MNANTPRMQMRRPGVAWRRVDVPRAHRRSADSVLCALLGIYLGSLVLEGVIRYLLVLAGVPNAIYLRDAIPLATLALLFVRPLVNDGKIDLAILLPAGVLAFHAAYSAMAGVAFFSIAFGLKILMFIPYGMAMWPLVRQRFDQALRWASFMFVVTAAGVVVNFVFGAMPWEGLEYESAFGTVSTTRVWWMGDAARLPGFARTSVDAAMILGITGLLTLMRFGRLWQQAGIAGCAAVGIVLTTSKGMILAFPLAALWVIVQQRNPKMKGAFLLWTLCGASAVLPLSMVFLGLGSEMSDASIPTILLSLWERFTSSWPEAFDLMPDGAQGLLGAGIGSIGSPQMYGNTAHMFSAADNFAVYMIVSFGVPGLLYYAAPVLLAGKVAAVESDMVHRAFIGMLLLAYGYGAATSMAEASFFSVFFGLCCGCAAAAWRRTAVHGEVLR